MSDLKWVWGRVRRIRGLGFGIVLIGASAVVWAGCPPAFAKSRTLSQAEMQISTSQYTRASEAYFRDGASSSMTSWRLGWQGEAEARGFFARASARNDFQAEEDHHYLKVFDLVAGGRLQNTRLALGRERQEWSVADEFWRLGVWQPRFTDDKLERETAGFTGAFLKVSGDDAHLLFFASPIWAPDTNAHFDVENDRFASKNPWFKPPTSVVNLDGIPTDVRYSFRRPETEDVIQHGMGAVQLEFRPTSTRFARLSAAYKPMNQILIGFPLELHMQNPAYATVDVKTRVLYQQVLTLETGVRDEDGWTGWFSLTAEKPFRDNPPDEWTTQEVSESVVGSVYVGKDVRGSGRYATHLFAGYLRVEGGDARDRGEILGKKSFFERRYYLQDALQLGVKHSAPWFTSKRLTRTLASVTYDFAQHGMVALIALHQPLDRYWTASLSADFIGLVDQAGAIQDGFTSSYRANDRVALGVQYVF